MTTQVVGSITSANEAELAIAAWNLGDKDQFAQHLAFAKQLAETCPPGQLAGALRVVMTAELKGEQYVVAVETAKKLHQADPGSTGEVALVRRLASELERLKPDHELISREAQQKLISAAMANQLAQKGYQYEPSTAQISKINS